MGDGFAQFGRYKADRSLGSGGMGEVFLAYSPAGEPVAVKVIRGDRLDEHTRARFEREALIARTVIGTNRVARFLDADPYEVRPWLAMEYVPGRTLLEYVDEHGVLPLPLVASLGALVAEGLDAVHAAGLLHRDLKPQNIILGAHGPVIIDFGLAAFVDASHDSISHSGMIIGTVRCMPPEQAGGHPDVTTAADVYALGTVLLYAAAGHYPYDGPRWDAIVTQVVNPQAQPDLSGVPAGLLPLLESMLAHEPGGRPALADVAGACATILADAGITAADARLALIARTAGTSPSAVAGPSLPASVEAWLDAQNLSDDPAAQPSPLDAPRGTGDKAGDDQAAEGDEPGRTAASVPAEATERPEPRSDVAKIGPTTGKAQVRQRPRRVPASRRIAEELRAEYAVHPAL